MLPYSVVKKDLMHHLVVDSLTTTGHTMMLIQFDVLKTCLLYSTRSCEKILTMHILKGYSNTKYRSCVEVGMKKMIILFKTDLCELLCFP
jgi:hypothetical protein